MHQAVELFADLDIWWSMSGTADGTMSPFAKHNLKLALWRFANYCDLNSNNEHGFQQNMRDQISFLSDLSHAEVTDMAKAYDDLSCMLHPAHSDMLASIFDKYFALAKQSLDLGGSIYEHPGIEKRVVYTVEARFNEHIDGLLAKGLPALIQLHKRINAHEKLPQEYEVSRWHPSGSFFPEAFDQVMKSEWVSLFGALRILSPQATYAIYVKEVA